MLEIYNYSHINKKPFKNVIKQHGCAHFTKIHSSKDGVARATPAQRIVTRITEEGVTNNNHALSL